MLLTNKKLMDKYLQCYSID